MRKEGEKQHKRGTLHITYSNELSKLMFNRRHFPPHKQLRQAYAAKPCVLYLPGWSVTSIELNWSVNVEFMV